MSVDTAAAAAAADAPEQPILKAEIIVAGRGESRQPADEQRGASGSVDNVIAPPLDPGLMAKWSEIASTRAGIIEAIARNTVGLGFTIEVPADEPQTGAKPPNLSKLADEAREIAATLNELARRDTRLGRPSFTDLLVAVKTDEEETGTGYLEVSRTRLTGRIDGLYHLPSKRMRRRKDRKGWVLLNADGTPGTEYLNFGDKVEYDDDGPTGDVAEGADASRNEVIEFRLYSSESRDYGMPRDSSLAIEYLGDKNAAESTASFFDSGGTPPSILFVSGEEQRDGQRITFVVPPATVSAIADTIKSDAGHKKRVAVIPLPPGSEVEHVKLGEVSDRDVGHNEYRKTVARRTLARFRVAPIFLSDVDGSGRYSAEVQRALTLEQVFDPEQKRWEDRLRETVLRDLGFYHRTIKFVRLAVESDQAKRESADQLATVGDITNREHRKAHGYGPLPEVQVGDKLVDGREVVEQADPEPIPAAIADPAAPPTPPADPSARASGDASRRTGAPRPVTKADPSSASTRDPSLPDPADPSPGPDDPDPELVVPERPTEVALADVTADDAAKIGKVPAGWNDQLVKATRQTANQPFGGASDGSDVPHPDQRGLRPGLAGRQQQSNTPPSSGGDLAKGHGVEHVEAEVDALRDELEGLSDKAVDRALKRTHTLAAGIADQVAVRLKDGRELNVKV